MLRPPQNTFFLQAALTSTATALMTGCSAAEVGGIAVGVGVAVLGTGWAAYRRFSSMRDGGNSAENALRPPTAALPSPETPKKTVPPLKEEILRAYLQKQHPILKEGVYGPLTEKMIQKIIAAWNESDGNPASLRPLINEQLKRVREDLRNWRHNPILLRLLEALEPPAESARKTIEALSLEGIYHPDPKVAVMAAAQIAEIANKDHSRIPMLPLVGLRSGFARNVPRELATAFINALSQIASPSRGLPAQDVAVSDRALRILIEDGLSHPDREIAETTRRALQGVLSRRPEIFSDEMQKAMKG